MKSNVNKNIVAINPILTCALVLSKKCERNMNKDNKPISTFALTVSNSWEARRESSREAGEAPRFARMRRITVRTAVLLFQRRLERNYLPHISEWK